MFNTSCRRCRDSLLEYSAGVLSPLQRRAVDAHLATCSSCRKELEFWRSLGDIVADAEAQLPADTGSLAGFGRLREAILARKAVDAPLESSQLREHESTKRTQEPGYELSRARRSADNHGNQALRRLAATTVAGAAVLLVIVGSIALFQDPQLFGGSPQLVWKKSALPPGVLLAVGVRITSPAPAIPAAEAPNAVLYVSPNNGEVAYICQTLASSPPRVWRSVDDGQRWVLLPAVPVSSAFDSCSVETDQSDPRTVLVALSELGARPDLTFLLTDGAQEWQPASNGIESFASWHQVAFAIKDTGVVIKGTPPPQAMPGISADVAETALYVSTDLNRSWREISGPILQQAKGQIVPFLPQELWVQPETGTLLVWTRGGLLWTSSDQGEHWRQIAFGGFHSTGPYVVAFSVLVQQPVGGEPLHICTLLEGETVLPTEVEPENAAEAPFYCSHDGGQTWKQRPPMSLSVQGNPEALWQIPLNFYVMLADGSVVIIPSPPNRDIVRIPADASDLTSGYVIGSNPPPTNPNNIPLGLIAPTAEGAIFWQPYDARTVYVATYA
jgi:anti-sigma factor RsiW